MGFLFSFSIALVAGVIMSVLVIAALLGAMYLLHEKFPDVLEDNSYGEFSFDNFTQASLMQLLTKLGLIVGVPTIVLFMIVFLLEYLYWVPHTATWDYIVAVGMFIPHFGLVFAGFAKLMEFPLKKAGILAGIATLALILIYMLLLPRNMLY